ncbi:very-short-patch-repair endonuclease [Evansella vedderi]|uniref:Very-short-patch-repair endonuclease n=1 Tax=Evansella vedderi TaxID=38282 RepID=A0ABU0A388_9BACI|nr:DUF559 domain-containing protein [Evansella vedderi]MDQ0257954.1 very-short-patch-repair endonuclease [Evansella vedderi]
MDYFIFFSLLLFPLILALKYDYTKPEHDKERYKCQSPIESRLYEALKRNGYPVSTQVREGPYSIDIALRGARIAIECDGKDYHSSPSQKERDRKRDAFLRRRGWKVLRFSGKRIYRDLNGILARIEKEIIKKL